MKEGLVEAFFFPFREQSRREHLPIRDVRYGMTLNTTLENALSTLAAS